MFPKEWARFSQPMWIEQPDGSPASGATTTSWCSPGTSRSRTSPPPTSSSARPGCGYTAYLLDQIRARTNFNASLEAIKALSAKWPQAVAKFLEDEANGPAAINSLQKQLVGLIPIEPEGSKYARASAISPLAHAGNVVLPTVEPLANVEKLCGRGEGVPERRLRRRSGRHVAGDQPDPPHAPHQRGQPAFPSPTVARSTSTRTHHAGIPPTSS